MATVPVNVAVPVKLAVPDAVSVLLKVNGLEAV
jgi:hypothetical protein